MNSKSLVTSSLPQNLRSKEVHRSARNYNFAVAPRVGVRGIHGHDGVVFPHCRTQQQRAILSEPQGQPAEEPGVLTIQPEFASAESVDVTESIENGERVPLF